MKVAVLMGGSSSERDVSLASGVQVVKALLARGHQVAAIDTYHGKLDDAQLAALLEAGVRPAAPSERELAIVRRKTGSLIQPGLFADADVIFLALHGGTGEDGTLQAVLDAAGLTYTGSGHVGSAAAMDKDLAKRLFTSVGIRTPAWRMHPIDPRKAAAQLGLPLIVKANRQGSTVGLNLVHTEAELGPAVDAALAVDREVMFEQFIPGRELTVGVLHGEALAVGEIFPKGSGIFHYDEKYQPGGAKEVFPADLPPPLYEALQRDAVAAHHALKLGDYSRADFRLDPEGSAWCLEVNSLPGLTSASLLPKSAAAVGMGFPELCERICQLALQRRIN
ncbi:MAG TPA: D-alanine--D-alanine ligase [Chthoniobacterales bacterium]